MYFAVRANKILMGQVQMPPKKKRRSLTGGTVQKRRFGIQSADPFREISELYAQSENNGTKYGAGDTFIEFPDSGTARIERLQTWFIDTTFWSRRMWFRIRSGC